MQLFEVKKDIAKIEYNPSENNISPSDFVLIEDSDQKIIAQIFNISSAENPNSNIAEVKFSLSIDEEDNLSYYNGFLPTKDAIVIYVKPEEIIALIKDKENNIYLGNLTNHKDCFVSASMSLLKEKLYIQSDRDDKTKVLIQNITSELYSKNNNVILLDFDGRYNSILNVQRLKISENLKLPLNIEAFNVILEKDTKTYTKDEKTIITNIVDELREYLESLKDKYIPFSTFKSVIEEEIKTENLSCLNIFYKKLEEYEQECLFAENNSEYNLLNDILNKYKTIIIDASDTNEKWHKLIIETILNNVSSNSYLILSLNDTNLDENSIKELYNYEQITPIVSTNFEYPQREILKSLCKNKILFKPAKNIQDTDCYIPLLNKMTSGDFILYGESTLFVSLIIELKSFDANTEEEVLQNEIKQDVDDFLSSGSTFNKEEQTSDEIIEDIFDDKSDDLSLTNNDINDIDLDFLEEDKEDGKEVEYGIFEPVNSTADLQEDNLIKTDEIIEINENTDDTNIIDNDNIEQINSTEHLENEILSDDDSIIETILPDDNAIPDNNISTVETEKPDENEIIENSASIIDSILPENTENSTDNTAVIDNIIPENNESSTDNTTVIDNIIPENNESSTDNTSIIDTIIPKTNEIKEDNASVVENSTINIPKENQTKNEFDKNTKKKLTKYETDTTSSNLSGNEIPFKIGDKVYHPKHGKGVIEGFANYSNKILFCQIEFENVGRRILDPRISGLEKIS